MEVVVVSVEASKAVAVTAEAGEMTGRCLRLFVAIAAKIAKYLSGLLEINPCIAVIVLKKWEIGAKESRSTDLNTNLNLKLLTPNWTKY